MMRIMSRIIPMWITLRYPGVAASPPACGWPETHTGKLMSFGGRAIVVPHVGNKAGEGNSLRCHSPENGDALDPSRGVEGHGLLDRHGLCMKWGMISSGGEPRRAV